VQGISLVLLVALVMCHRPGPLKTSVLLDALYLQLVHQWINAVEGRLMQQGRPVLWCHLIHYILPTKEGQYL